MNMTDHCKLGTVLVLFMEICSRTRWLSVITVDVSLDQENTAAT